MYKYLILLSLFTLSCDDFDVDGRVIKSCIEFCDTWKSPVEKLYYQGFGRNYYVCKCWNLNIRHFNHEGTYMEVN